MLYATTRSKVATYTAQRALKEERAPDGGLYVPTQFPSLEEEELTQLLQQPPGAVVAEILNRFFKSRLSQWDVEFAAGKHLYGITHISHRIVIGELWRNAEGSFEGVARRLAELASAQMGVGEPGMWMRIACRIALVFAIFGELYRTQAVPWGETVDIAAATGNFEGPYAAWAARSMGLPVGTIVCCCNENSGVWDLINRGQIKLNPKIRHTRTPKYDIPVPEALELLIYSRLKWDNAEAFVELKRRGGTFFLGAEEHRHFREGLYACVVSDKRLTLAIPNLYQTNGYILCPYSALAYTGLMDYRSRPGRRRAAVMLTEFDPRDSADTVVRALSISGEELREWCLGG